MRATFVYANPRAALLEGVLAGSEPDSALLGMNHLGEHGIEAGLHDPLLSRRSWGSSLDRVVWNARELTLPAELGRTDVVFTPLAALFPLAARARRLPVVVVNYGLNLIWRRASRRRRSLLRAALGSAACVVCLGESQRLELVAVTGISEERTATLLVPVDERFFSPAQTPDVGHVLTVGKDLARDFATFADAVRGLDAAARIVTLSRNLTGVQLPSNATVLQRVPSTALRDLYARAACVVVPQRGDDFTHGSEGGGLTALVEAMAMGKAIVATERAVLHDYVADGRDALLVPAGDPAAMREAITRVLGDRDLAARLGAAARQRAATAFTTRRFAARLAPLLARAAG